MNLNRIKIAAIALCVTLPLIMPLFQLTHAQQPRYGGTFVRTEGYKITSLNSLMVPSPGSNARACRAIYDNLVTMNVNFEVLPSLAEEWDISDDGTVYTFKLVKNASWHDGQPFTAKDVKFTYDMIFELDDYYARTLISLVEEVKMIDDYTIEMVLSSPDATFLTNLADLYSNSQIILPEHLWNGTDYETNPHNESPIGTGPFKFSEWVRGSFLTLEANENYWRGKPYLDTYVIREFTDVSTIVAALAAGEVDHDFSAEASVVPPTESTRLANQNDDLELFLWPGTRIYHIQFNMRVAPFNDTRVRQAIAYALDRDRIVDIVTDGSQEASKHMYIEDHWATNPDVVYPDVDLEEAKRLLDEAGYPEGTDGVRMKLQFIGVQSVTSECELIVQDLTKVGIDAELIVNEWSWYVENIIEGVLQDPYAFTFAMRGGSHGPDPGKFEDYLGTGRTSGNMMNYSNADVDNLFAMGKDTADPEVRKDYYYQIQEIIYDDMPRLNWRMGTEYLLYKTEWHGLWFLNSDLGYQDMSKVWSEKGELPATPWIEVYLPYIIAAVVIVVAIAGIYSYTRYRSKGRN